MEGTLLVIALLVVVLAMNIEWHRNRKKRDAERERREDERWSPEPVLHGHDLPGHVQADDRRPLVDDGDGLLHHERGHDVAGY